MIDRKRLKKKKKNKLPQEHVYGLAKGESRVIQRKRLQGPQHGRLGGTLHFQQYFG
jgi:hypothetical protein